MLNKLGFSVYVSNYDRLKERLQAHYEPGTFLFTSFHIPEEMDGDYVQKSKVMCQELREMGYRIIADVSKRTLAVFGKQSLTAFAEEMGVSVLRIDYGFSEAEMIEAGKAVPLCFNASTVDEAMMKRLKENVDDIFAMHNFYPRPETGLDEEFLLKVNQSLQINDISCLSFIPGDKVLRGPLFESLPTLEIHRNVAPYACYVDYRVQGTTDGIFTGDGIPGDYNLERIRNFERDGVIELPVDFMSGYEYLYQMEFTMRPDSPRWLKRLVESREYATPGQTIVRNNCSVRNAGCITIDNEGYGRYSGEIQIVIEDLPVDERVNVIGMISERYRLLLRNLRNGCKIRFIEVET